MVVGAVPGAAAGIAVVDHADRDQRIRRYVHGPRWSPHYVDHAGVMVLPLSSRHAVNNLSDHDS
jgi:hypothetical protein